MATKVIYEPKGKAREYADLALNLYRGCGHGCTYCYVPPILHESRQAFHNPAGIRQRKDLWERLAQDAAALAGDPRQILLSFTSDPYQPAEKDYRLTRQALIQLANYGLTCAILTKGGYWGLERDQDLLTQLSGNSWATTLTCCDEADSRKWEPGAASPIDRISSLYLAKKYGLQTWVSFEPVLDPAQVYLLLEMTHEFTDHYKVGKLNYHPHALAIDWRRFKGEIEARLNKLGKSYYLKKDLLEAAG